MRFAFAFAIGLTFGVASAVADPLHDAAKAGDLQAVQQLVGQGSDLSAPDRAGDPPLVLAALAGHADVVAYLLSQGADIAVRNKGGLTALHAAAYAGNLEVTKLLVAKGAAVNDQMNFYHMSPLHAAAEEGHTDVVVFLLANKAEVEAKERNGYTPLSQAGWRDHWDTAVPLIKAGAVCQKADLVGDRLFQECTKRQ
ncbi:ankyrin repeat domain-containing protein [Pseudaminobacter sp. 19-2017]|uniref:Ankyrin repeat domain-containing protein n=1 Tax=Pseudaminobacter soli (ex Zhang et al. 2022) TaxID=2831468 RepID=A0A942E4F8_9HYPH|nr:ankyrin repeat domain-containing protein [Pseudaminobacter soli]MBS3650370.1 ankyrin repeat domain-containing protein [Pseudaminobacter soli]